MKPHNCERRPAFRTPGRVVRSISMPLVFFYPVCYTASAPWGSLPVPHKDMEAFYCTMVDSFLSTLFPVFRKILPAFPAVPSGAAFLCAAGRRQTKVCRRPAVLQSVGFPSGQSWTSRRRLTAAESWMVRTLAPATYLPTAAVLFFTGVMVPAPATQPPGQPMPSSR